jgi:ABC-2 type transport system permease protein
MKMLNKIVASKFGWVVLLLLLFAVNFLAARFHTRADLTKEKRYTLSKATRTLISQLDGDVRIDVFLKGDFNAGFRKLANSTDEFLQLLKDQNGSKIHYEFISPTESIPGARGTWADSLSAMGAIPINLTVQQEAGKSSNIIYPVAVITYNGNQSLVNLYTGASGRITQDEINGAESLMEYQFTKTLSKLAKPERPGIAYATGNGEPVDGRTYDMQQTLREDYDFRTFDLQAQPMIPAAVDVLMIVKPSLQFSEEEKFKIDQFVMRGGKLLCFMDALIAEQDSLAYKPETIAFDRNLNLTDLFFKYGLRVNTNLVMDLQCDLIPFIVGGTQDNPQYEFLHWNYFPLLSPSKNNVLNKNLGYVAAKFANSIDTINVPGIVKTPLLVTSSNSRIISTPALISLNENKNLPQDAKFRLNAIPVAMLLEGKFTSLYRNRTSKAQMDSLNAQGFPFNASAQQPTKMIVVADGDMVFNDFLPAQGEQPTPLPMGWNKYTYTEVQKETEYGKLFVPVANRDFLLNSVEYLVNNEAVLETRNKDIVLRLLDAKKVRDQKSMWQLVNIALPILLVILFGWIYQALRKRKYAA